jgi:ribosomal-protein-alanine N-acetyltransferase
MSVPLRALATADAGWVAALHRAAFPGAGWPAEDFATLLGLPGYYGLAALGAAPLPAEVPAGFVLALLAAEDCEVITLAVRPESRRAGVARALLSAALDRAAAAGATAAHLEVGRGNAAAVALYRSAGFAAVGCRRGYYDEGGRGEDAIRMTLPLAGA